MRSRKDPLKSENLEYGAFPDFGGSLDYGVACGFAFGYRRHKPLHLRSG